MKIMVMNTVQASLNGAADLMNKIDIDNHQILKMPAHIKIGGTSWDGHKIMHYAEMVGEYDIWLEDALKAQDLKVMQSLEDIFAKAQGAGVVLTTICLPSPFHTHAHVIMNTILKLAGEGDARSSELQQQ